VKTRENEEHRDRENCYAEQRQRNKPPPSNAPLPVSTTVSHGVRVDSGMICLRRFVSPACLPAAARNRARVLDLVRTCPRTAG
jgi:hypothetical protein